MSFHEIASNTVNATTALKGAKEPLAPPIYGS